MSLKTYFKDYLWDIVKDTLYMVSISTMIASFIALFLGILLFYCKRSKNKRVQTLYLILNLIVNIFRSFPFYILIFYLIPFTRSIIKLLTGVGTSMSTTAFIVPLTIAAMFFFAKLVENALYEVKEDVIQAAYSLGLSRTQVIFKVLLKEALPGIISGLTLGIITLIGFSSMAGVVGGGGIGAFAIDHGLTNYDSNAMFFAVITIIAIVQIIQFIGNKLYKITK